MSLIKCDRPCEYDLPESHELKLTHSKHLLKFIRLVNFNEPLFLQPPEIQII